MSSMNLRCSKCDFSVHIDMKRSITPTHADYESAAKMFGLTLIDGKYVCKECLQTASDKAADK